MSIIARTPCLPFRTNSPICRAGPIQLHRSIGGDGSSLVRCAIPNRPGRAPGMFPDGRGLSGLAGVVALARGIRVPGLRLGRRSAPANRLAVTAAVIAYNLCELESWYIRASELKDAEYRNDLRHSDKLRGTQTKQRRQRRTPAPPADQVPVRVHHARASRTGILGRRAPTTAPLLSCPTRR